MSHTGKVERHRVSKCEAARWPDFTGFGVVPGIRAARFEVQTPDVVGSRIRVTNTDGSSHIEEIVEWQPDRRLRIRMHEFSAPLSRVASHFEETWEFQRIDDKTRVVRFFEMHPKSAVSQPLLVVISLFPETSHRSAIAADVGGGRINRSMKPNVAREQGQKRSTKTSFVNVFLAEERRKRSRSFDRRR
jgi:hypothetical protein